MTEPVTEPTPLQIVNQAKQVHAQTILDSIDATLVAITAEPDLWYGGTPDTFSNLKTHLQFNASEISKAFSLQWTDPTA